MLGGIKPFTYTNACYLIGWGKGELCRRDNSARGKPTAIGEGGHLIWPRLEYHRVGINMSRRLTVAK